MAGRQLRQIRVRLDTLQPIKRKGIYSAHEFAYAERPILPQL